MEFETLNYIEFRAINPMWFMVWNLEFIIEN